MSAHISGRVFVSVAFPPARVALSALTALDVVVRMLTGLIATPFVAVALAVAGSPPGRLIRARAVKVAGLLAPPARRIGSLAAPVSDVVRRRSRPSGLRRVGGGW